MNYRIGNIVRIIAISELIIGFILLLNETLDYLHLPTTQEIENEFGQTVDWFQYKESCYKNLFLHFLLTITGLSFWLNKKLYWGLTQALIITLFFVTMINLWVANLFRPEINICLSVLLTLIVLYIEIKICNPLDIKIIGINKVTKYLCFFGGLFSCIVWLILFLM